MSEAILPKPFDGNDHRSFVWPGQRGAALLVHGFPGTPAEMRPLGLLLRDAAWTVHGLMLPGMGADIENLDRCTAEDWSAAVSQALGDLQRRHAPILLIGYSMGAALALDAAAKQRPDGLVLLAPFWSFAGRWLSLLWPALRLFVHRVQPLKRADFSAPEVRRGLERMFGSVDLENPQIERALRGISASMRPIDQLHRLGRRAFDQVAAIDVPALVIQGVRDQVVPADRTRRLVKNFPRPVAYCEVDAGHDLVDPACGAWDQVKQQFLNFALSLQPSAATISQSSNRMV